ncbi:NADP-dependent malic enzyme [Marinivivus vitaminiproducens]|uniref:NADP-dependent malic enzyme n=1 Tax=Marinivivus vitaminiproducens TaxID=3035935 RepID=UPI00279F834F|nr:NADP-dependent malic enzyme [Geminicoccaceae bacterium SCSIO 64248]
MPTEHENQSHDEAFSAAVTDQEALEMHASGRRGKIEVTPTKPLTTQRDLSLAYSPGVAAPCRVIRDDPDKAYDYTAKGNLVAVISNGTAVLGLGNLGALASKPVMEGKAVLFKRFADIDAIDLEIGTEDVDRLVDAVALTAPTFGGINLEDIKAPECFIIEQRLREMLDIPVFHDDQHGTAIITAAGLINALDLTGRDLQDTKVVINGAGAAAIACLDLIKAMGLPHDNAILCDTKGVIHKDRTDLNQWKSAHAVETGLRTLTEAMRGADVFLGLSAKGAVTAEMVRSMADKPIVFAMANPDPEITPEEAHTVRPDVIMATGRSDYPNQVNNVLGFPYIFRGALDVQATTINDAMKIAAAYAIAALARQEVPDEVSIAYRNRRLRYGPNYLIPTPFDPRLMTDVPPAVARAAADSGVARKPIVDYPAYAAQLRSRLSPTGSRIQLIIDRVRGNPKRLVFAEGEEEKMVRAAIAWRNSGLGTPILVGREDEIHATLNQIGVAGTEGLEIVNARLAAERNPDYADYLYRRLQRSGFLLRDCQRLIHTDRNLFAACMVAAGDGDAMVTGLTRPYRSALDDALRVFDPKPGEQVYGLSILLARNQTVFLADTSVHEQPEPEMLADIACQAARRVRDLGFEPRVALLSFSTFGDRVVQNSTRMKEAVDALDRRKVDFEYDGELSARVALDPDLLRLYPFCRLSAPANVLILPSLHSAHIGAIMLQQIGNCTAIGPLLQGLAKPVQIVPMNAGVSDIISMAAIAAFESSDRG